MLTSLRPVGAAALLCLAGAAAHVPAQAAQWRIVNATVDQLSFGAGADPSIPLLHLQLPNAGAPFQDGQYPQPGEYAAWVPSESETVPANDFFFLWFFGSNSEGLRSPPSIDLANMQAHFDALELRWSFWSCAGKIGCSGGSSHVANLGTEDPIAITQVGADRYNASWSVRSTGWYEVPDDSVLPLYSVNLTFVAFPEGTPWSYAPSVPEPSSVFMALVGIGAVGVIRRRQARRLAAS